MLEALCVLGVSDYITAQKMILSALDRVRVCKERIVRERNGVVLSQIPDEIHGPMSGIAVDFPVTATATTTVTAATTATTTAAHSVSPSNQNRSENHNHSHNTIDYDHLSRCEWVLCYHSAICLYSTGRYGSAIKVSTYTFVIHYDWFLHMLSYYVLIYSI